MIYYLFIENGRINGAGQVPIVHNDTNCFIVDEETYNKYCADQDFYIWDGTNVVPNPDYEQIQMNKREEEFNRNFFYTHLGYVKREVTMKNGALKDFLTDLFPAIKVGLPIYTYDKPDFSKDVTPEILLTLQHLVRADEQFLADCENQFALDFYGFNPLEQIKAEQAEQNKAELDKSNELCNNEEVEEEEE